MLVGNNNLEALLWCLIPLIIGNIVCPLSAEQVKRKRKKKNIYIYYRFFPSHSTVLQCPASHIKSLKGIKATAVAQMFKSGCMPSKLNLISCDPMRPVTTHQCFLMPAACRNTLHTHTHACTHPHTHREGCSSKRVFSVSLPFFIFYLHKSVSLTSGAARRTRL